MHKKTVLIVEDEISIADSLTYNLGKAGYTVVFAKNGNEAMERMKKQPPDIVLLDLMLPFVDGLEVCRWMRAQSELRDTPIIIVTAKAEETDQLIGFANGADDYVIKPFSIEVLMARMRSLLRGGRDDPDDIASLGGVTVNRATYRVTAGDSRVELTMTEFRLLETLIFNPSRVYSNYELIQTVIGRDSDTLEVTMRTHIRGLRKKLGAHANVIENIKEEGYRFRVPEEASAE